MARALEENLRRTAVPVEIPDEHLLLLEITDHLHGIRRQTEQLLREVHHRYAGWAQTLEDLHRHAMGDFYHYNTHPRSADALQIFGGAGYTKLHPIERYWRDARLTKIFEGTSEIQLRIISDQMLGKPTWDSERQIAIREGGWFQL